MKTETLYLILNQAGRSWVLKDRSLEPASLGEFLAQGWKPVRETPFSSGADRDPAILILLEREVEGSFGFGFRPA